MTPLTTEPGTNCLTQAEDAVREALGRCEAWRRLCRPYGTDDPVSEEDGLARVHIDRYAPPVDEGGDALFFAWDELEDNRVLGTVLHDPEQSIAFYGAEEPTVTTAVAVLAVIETVHPQREQSEGVNLQRRVKNLVPDVARQTLLALRDAKGPRWMQAARVQQLADLLFEEFEEGQVGVRTQSVILFEIGPGGTGGGE